MSYNAFYHAFVDGILLYSTNAAATVVAGSSSCPILFYDLHMKAFKVEQKVHIIDWYVFFRPLGGSGSGSHLCSGRPRGSRVMSHLLSLSAHGTGQEGQREEGKEIKRSAE